MNHRFFILLAGALACAPIAACSTNDEAGAFNAPHTRVTPARDQAPVSSSSTVRNAIDSPTGP